ncbi:MAG: long-chain-fatty-acid--CoA ligase [Actinophytocola sp.]|uniref:long-chain-fatty-acid--CoA ligase n=1 Tax=Actinophytocola sp. TaxID=1872138 RepID=UPI0013295188|nr:long-chain-fatty-acid--CoA ligase [Actinophytocola sp.]MPZ81188.1 long-chain-fatty-acid--CoA ligase [Actinophytocola sp.]
MSRLRTLADLARVHASTKADHPAMLCQGRRVDYATLYKRAKQAAHGIRAAGLRQGDRLAYLGKESEHYYELVFGAAKSGTVLVPVNWRLTAAEVEHVLADSGSALLFVDADAAELAEKVVTGLPRDVRVVALDRPGEPGAVFVDWLDTQPDTELLARVRPEDPIIQMYTSGTTGLPKGVVLAHRGFFAVRDALASEGLDWIDWQPGDRSLVGVPGFHVGGLWWAVQGFAAGVTNVLMRAFTPPDAVELIRSLGVTTTCMVPAMLRQVLAEPGVSTDDFATLRKVVYGGSPISESLLDRCIEVLGCDLAQIYGLTETGNTALCLPPADHVPGGRLQAAGRPYPGFAVEIRDVDGAVLAPGEVGEVCLRTPGAMLEYWNRPEATATTLVDGWVRTGDAGYLDGDGYLFIRDRIKDMIIVAGENVYPAEIENAISGHPDVAEVAVVGVPDPRWGEAVHAFVVPVPGAELAAADLAGYLHGRLATFKMPLRYELVDAVPRNPSGKILRRELRAKYWRDQARSVN